MPKETREWDIYKAVDASIKNFLVSVPCVSDLKSPSMRDRHWEQLMEVGKINLASGSYSCSCIKLA